VEGERAIDAAADMFAADAEFVFVEQGCEGFVIAFSNAEDAGVVDELSAADDVDMDAVFVRAEAVERAEEKGIPVSMNSAGAVVARSGERVESGSITCRNPPTRTSGS
jgi:hypothetical protein